MLDNKKTINITHASLLLEWDYTKNRDLKPEKLTAGSSRYVWWKCRRGHSWSTRVNRRTQGHGCPTCRHIGAEKGKSLSDVFPLLVEEWDFSINKEFLPTEVKSQSNRKVSWVCKKCKHVWKAKICDRTKKNSTGCPVCSGYLVSDRNRFSTKFLYLLKEWDFNKNLVKPSQLSCNSHKRVFWICSKFQCGYSWSSILSSRTRNCSAGCPACSRGPISKISQKWLDALEVPIENREYFVEELDIRVDAYLPKTNTVYEFLGDYWHGNPRVYSPEKINPNSKKMFGILYKNTLSRLKKIQDCGFNLICIWECDFKESKPATVVNGLI